MGRMQKFTYLLSIFAIMAVLGCENPNDVEYGFVDERLQPFFQRFSDEADLRGVAVDLSTSNIEAFVQTVFPNSVAGQCQRNTDRPSQIIIDVQSWNERNDTEKEFLIFHELGHCILDREHRDDTDNSGKCLSIMHSVEGICRNEYESQRKEYLDELFR